MIRMHHRTLSVALLGVLALAGQSAPAQTPVWRYDYNAGRKEATEKRRPLLVEFATDNCYWCKRLDATTFRDPKVAAVLNDRFITLKIDADQNPQLTQRLRVQSFPTLVLASHDGKILAFLEGYLEAPALLEHLHKALAPASGAPPEWMARDYQEAAKCIANGDNSRAVALLKTIIEADKDLPIRKDAQQVLHELEKQADNRLAHAHKMEDSGQALEAIDTLSDLMRQYAGTAAANEAKGLLTSLAAKPEIRERQRTRRARELMAQAREEFRTQQFFGCLEKCELIAANYADLPEGVEAAQLAGDIKANPEWLTKACSNLNEKAASMYLTLADSWIKKGRPDEATRCLDKVVQLMPGSHFAQIAQLKQAQLQGKPNQQTDFKKQ